MEPADLACVRALIVQGLEERWGRYDPGFNPDLENFPDAYIDAMVWVAKHASEVVGVGVLQSYRPDTARIVRMSVHKAFQRQGVGSLILHQLLPSAQERKVRRIELETTAGWTSAVEFYKHRDFCPTQ